MFQVVTTHNYFYLPGVIEGKITAKMKVTGLNIDCIESNFEYLGLGDLLNAADSNVRLRMAANFIFVRRYQNKKIWFREMCISPNRLITIEEEHIKISDLKTSLQLLRCFGRFIRTIYSLGQN